MDLFDKESEKEPEWNGHGDGSVGLDNSAIMLEGIDAGNSRRQARNVRSVTGTGRTSTDGRNAGVAAGGFG